MMVLRTTSEVSKMVEQLTQSEGSRVVIEVWSDLGCPWCYVGKHRLQAAIAQRPDADRFEIVMRSFELDPGAPQEPEKNEKSFIRAHGGTAADVLQAERQMQAIARKEGLEFSLDRLNANTFDLHRVVQYANDQGRGFEFFSDIQDGFFAGTLSPYAPDTLAGVAETVGLDGQRVREILASNEYANRVRADRTEGLELGAAGVPFVVLDRRVAAPGAEKVPVYGQLLEQVAGPVPSERAS
jgi:predicted DsbA family dithiol-disulfide isomerase